MAAKRIRPIDGQQDFGFLKSDSGPKPETGQSGLLFPEVPDKAEASGLDFSGVEASSGLFPDVPDAPAAPAPDFFTRQAAPSVSPEVGDAAGVTDVAEASEVTDAAEEPAAGLFQEDLETADAPADEVPDAENNDDSETTDITSEIDDEQTVEDASRPDIEPSVDEMSTTELTDAAATDTDPDFRSDDSNDAVSVDEPDEASVEEFVTGTITAPSEVAVAPSVPASVSAPVATSVASPARATAAASATASAVAPAAVGKTDRVSDSSASSDHVSRKLFVGVAGYAIALTLLLLGLLVTERLALSSNHVLESLPDLRPLKPNEFRPVPDGTELPDGHVMRIGESRRFGDVVVTPVRVSTEALKFQSYNSGAPEDKLTTKPVMRLWLTFENVGDYAFPPFDAGLMSSRTPPDSQDEATMANSFLTVGVPSGEKSSTRVLNFLQKMDNYFVITGQDGGKVLAPNESLTTFVASNEEVNGLKTADGTSFVWRIQFRKGVNTSSGNGVTTLIDVKFSGADLANAG